MGIMKDNIGKVLDRGEKLTDLQDKSGAKTCDILIIVIIIIVIVIIILVIIYIIKHLSRCHRQRSILITKCKLYIGLAMP